jgi:hypothetical protein
VNTLRRLQPVQQYMNAVNIVQPVATACACSKQAQRLLDTSRYIYAALARYIEICMQRLLDISKNVCICLVDACCTFNGWQALLVDNMGSHARMWLTLRGNLRAEHVDGTQPGGNAAIIKTPLAWNSVHLHQRRLWSQ